MDSKQIEWLVTAIAEEIAGHDAQDAALLVSRLRSRLGYGCADPGFGADGRAEQERIALVEGIARRLEARPEAAAVVRLRRTEIAA